MTTPTQVHPPAVLLDADLYGALYELAHADGYYPELSDDQLRDLVHEVLGAYVKAKGPQLKAIAKAKLEAENEALAAASERVLEGQRVGRAMSGLPPLPEAE